MKNQKSRIYYVLTLSKYIKHFKLRFILGLIIHLIFKLLPVLVSVLISYMIGNTLVGELKNIKIYFAVAIFLTLLEAVFYYLDIYVSHDVAYYILTELRNRVYEKIDEIAPAGIQNISTGDLISIVMEDIEILEWFYAHTTAQWFVALLLPVVSLIILSFFSIWITLAIIPFIFILILIPAVNSKKSNEQGRVFRLEIGRLNSKIIDGVQGIVDIVSFKWQYRYLKKIIVQIERSDKATMDYVKRSSAENVSIRTVISLAGLASQIVTVSLVIAGKVNAVYLLPIFAFSSLIYSPILEAIMFSKEYGMIFGAAERIFNILQLNSPVEDSGKLEENDIGEVRELSFEHVAFSYPGEKNKMILKDVSFSINTGETVVLVGASGSGKSTAVKLCERFWNTNSGEIKINGTNICDISLEALRNLITVVPQEIYLFNRTIRENILLARRDANNEELLEAAKQSQITDILEKLDDGWQTVVGERAIKLSGGERARLALAQAFLKNSPILLLDEASANLDSENERLINLAINRLKKGRITLIIAHRLSTIRSADRILLLKDGKIIESGKFDELFKTSQYFRRLTGEEYC